VVTPEGKAGNRTEKDIIRKCVGGVHGVKNVVNKMTVGKTLTGNNGDCGVVPAVCFSQL
jgi:osmotically-inducible protein OsmY